MDRERLGAYARLIVEKGLNPEPGQEVIVTASLDQPEFVRMVVAACYRVGAARVTVDWQDMPLAAMDYQYRTEEGLATLEAWEVAKWQWKAERLPAVLWLDSDDPDGMAGVDPGKRARAQMARFPKIKPFRDAMENKHQWCIAAVPGEKWAQKVFPGLAAADAVDALWAAIFKASRLDGDPMANWDEHNRVIRRRADQLNAYHFAELQYQAPNGTDFRVGLIPDGIFAGGAETDLHGRVFNPNIPSEEIFTSPRRGVAEGLLVATKPLAWQGALIENFSIRFHHGQAVAVTAEKGRETLEKIIAMDAGASFLGECALIACDSPIHRTGVLFYNTLFDENASCHVALGRGFDQCIADYGRYTPDELHAKGINDSMIHVDFMIGSAQLAITGITQDGVRVPVFRDGNWCF